MNHVTGEERTYHIFYQLLEGPLEFRRKIGLEEGDSAKSFVYTNPALRDVAQNVPLDVKPEHFVSTDLDSILVSLNLLNVCEEEQTSMFSTLVAILLLGQVTFEGGGDNSHHQQCRIGSASFSTVSRVAILLGVDRQALEQIMCHRELTVNQETTQVPLTLAEALSSRDSISAALYVMVFDWYVIIGLNFRIWTNVIIIL